jgi:hypothetical protein
MAQGGQSLLGAGRIANDPPTILISFFAADWRYEESRLRNTR